MQSDNCEVKIVNIVSCPQHVEIVANWIYNEFAKPKGDITLEFVIERFKNRNQDNLPLSLIAIKNNKCLGVVSFFENDLQPRSDLTPWLAGLYVDKDYRGQGIAEKLINGLLEVARWLNFDKVYLRTEHTGKYYEKLGWIFIEHTVDEYMEPTSVYYKKI